MCGVPVIATIDRGHCTVIDHEDNGILVPQNDPKALSDAIYKMYDDQEFRHRMSVEAVKKAAKFEIKNSLKVMSEIYSKFLY